MSIPHEAYYDLRSTSQTNLAISPGTKQRLKKKKCDITHLMPSDPMFDEHLRWKSLKSKVKRYIKNIKKEAEYFKVQMLAQDLDPQNELLKNRKLIKELLSQSDSTESFRSQLILSEIHRDDQANLLLIDPEASLKLSLLRAKIESQLKHCMMPKSLKNLISFLHDKVNNIDDLFIMTHVFLPEKLRKDLPGLLDKQLYKAFTPICFTHAPDFRKNTHEEIRRYFQSHYDYLSTTIKINGKLHHLAGASPTEFVIKFVEALNAEGWEPSLEPTVEAQNILNQSESLSIFKALAFNVLTQTLTTHKQHFSDPLSTKYKVTHIKRNRHFSIYLKSAAHFTVIRKFTWDIQHNHQSSAPGYSAVLYHMFSSLTYFDESWSEALFIKNVTVLDSSQQKFLESTFKAFEMWIQNSKY